MKNNYYIYIYLDPRKHGQYEYDDYCFLYKPFYVGKGKNKRYKKFDNRNKYFRNKINKIKKYRLESIVIKLFDNISEEQSFRIEKQLIQEIGRIDLNHGPLVNMTDGGEGSSGFHHSNKSKNLMSILRVGKNNNFYGKHHTERSLMLISKMRKNKCVGDKNPMFGKSPSIETREKISISNTGKFIGEKNNNSKLTEEKAKTIYQISNSPIIKQLKITQKEIGEIFNVDYTTVSKIKTRKYWRHIGEAV